MKEKLEEELQVFFGKVDNSKFKFKIGDYLCDDQLCNENTVNLYMCKSEHFMRRHRENNQMSSCQPLRPNQTFFSDMRKLFGVGVHFLHSRTL